MRVDMHECVHYKEKKKEISSETRSLVGVNLHDEV